LREDKLREREAFVYTALPRADGNVPFVDEGTKHRIKIIPGTGGKPSVDEAYKTCVAMEKGVGPKVYGAFQTPDGSIVLSMDDLEEGDLDHVLRTHAVPDGEVDNALVRLFETFQRASPLCHQDLHAKNIAFTRKSGGLVAKAIDWGLSDVTRDCNSFAATWASLSESNRLRLPKFGEALLNAGVLVQERPTKARRPDLPDERPPRRGRLLPF
jgi:hypothetical protein